MNVYRLGECSDCGECCRIWVKDHFEWCSNYDSDIRKHCRKYKNRPRVCKDYPASPTEITNKPQCTYRFISEKGIPVTI